MLPRQADYYNRHSDLSDDTMLTSTSSSISSTSTNTIATDCTSFRSISIHTAAAPLAVEQQHVDDEHKKQSAAALLGIQDFRILKPIGAGDIGKVYLCQLRRPTDGSYYAMKVIDRDVLELKKKTHRAEMEKETLKLLNHPFLPNVIAQFEASRFSCNVIDYCSGGDLHSLRHRQPNNRFSLSSARFYAAEVLMAFEYLHMLGIVYRDLKPENILVRADGHIMLTDFDLCLRSTSTPTLQNPDTPTNIPSPSLQQPSCLPKFRSRKVQTLAGQPTFVAEPTSARSSSFVGTHEYVAPEVASGNPHGSPVDWWAFGIFLYEMLYGRTPFVGESNEITLRNIVKSTLTFPNVTPISSAEVRARDLIAGLLNKDAANRLGTKKGAAEIKSHAFFKGVKFALIRSITPPEIPGKVKSARGDVIPAFDCF